MGLVVACYGLMGILIGLTKSTDHPSGVLRHLLPFTFILLRDF